MFLIGLYASNDNQECLFVISERIGEVLDPEERIYFNLLPGVKNFKSAVFLELPDSSYVIKVIYEKEGEEHELRIRQGKKEITRLKDYLDNYEKIIASKDSVIPQKKTYKSKTIAVCWSIGATIIPSTIGFLLVRYDKPPAEWTTYLGWTWIVGAPIIGPAAGHFYTQQWRRGLKGIGQRLGIGCAGCLASSILGQILIDDIEDYEGFFISSIPTCLGIVGILAYDIYDIISVPSSVERYNKGLKTKTGIDLKNEQIEFGIVYCF
ncbi:MAG: hypothetical protein ABIL70_08105 [candidate division WOR-3 bacterium]